MESTLTAIKWMALAWLVGCSLVGERAPVVRVHSGLVRGVLSADRTHHRYFGLPYGTVDHRNRFQAPLPPPKWEGIFDAVDESIRCPQKFISSMVLGDPDCLKLNIYSPTTKRDKLHPVMVYIHGGCFFEGTGSGFLYGGDYFVQQGVVFVGVNYRLNVEGFLCLGIKEAPGNAGLKDIIAALKWIKENIEAFGGDPNNVSLFGESAGSVATALLVLSTSASGLFHKAIQQSGSSLAPWALQHDPLKTASSLVKQFGYDIKDPKEIYDILSNKSVSELINAIPEEPHQSYIAAPTLFSPCIEKEIPGVEAALTQHPIDIFRSGNYSKIPMIIGHNDKEGIYFVAKDYGKSVEELNPVSYIKDDLEFPSEMERNMTVEEVKRQYFSSDKEKWIHGMVDFYSDLYFKFPVAAEAELFAQTTDQPIYFYLFKYDGYVNLPKLISAWWGEKGASHADELFYLFKPHAFPLPMAVLEQPMIQRMVTLWTNFAKYGDPTPSRSSVTPRRWLSSAASGRGPIALIIDDHLGTAHLWDDNTSSIRLWNETYQKFRRRSYGFTEGASEVLKGNFVGPSVSVENTVV